MYCIGCAGKLKTAFMGVVAISVINIFRLPQRSEEASYATSGSAADATSNFITRYWIDRKILNFFEKKSKKVSP